jgi:hypothetical protein
MAGPCLQTLPHPCPTLIATLPLVGWNAPGLLFLEHLMKGLGSQHGLGQQHKPPPDLEGSLSKCPVAAWPVCPVSHLQLGVLPAWLPQ